MNGPPTEREHLDLVARVVELERQVGSLREWRAQSHGVASVLGFVGGLIAAAIVSAIFKAIGG